MSAITTEIVVRDDVVCLLPVIPVDAPELVREGIARRRLVALEGRCLCGGQRLFAPGANNQVAYLSFVHEDDCPAVDDILLDAIAEWVP